MLSPSRALSRAARPPTVGNFWVDLTRATLYVLLPLSIVLALVLVALGMPQNLSAYVDATTLEGAKQTMAQGPVASQIAIKQLGTNGGGFFNVNAAHPYENPNAWTNLLQTWAIFSLALALAVTFGRMIGREREGWALLSVMVLFLAVGAAVAYWAEASGNPLMHALGVSGGNMEGKEVRFGTALSTVWAVFTTGASNGSVNSMHGSFMPLGGLGAARAHADRRGGAGRRRLGPLRHRRARHPRHVRRRPDGRAARRSISARSSKPKR